MAQLDWHGLTCMHAAMEWAGDGLGVLPPSQTIARCCPGKCGFRKVRPERVDMVEYRRRKWWEDGTCCLRCWESRGSKHHCHGRLCERFCVRCGASCVGIGKAEDYVCKDLAEKDLSTECEAVPLAQRHIIRLYKLMPALSHDPAFVKNTSGS